MKQTITTLLVLLAFSGIATAQSAFSINPGTVWTIAPHTNPDVEGHTTITNLTGATLPIKWERFTINITPGCFSKVCDINLCYTPPVSTKTFNLPANANGTLIMHFLNDDTIVGANALIHLKLTNQNNPADTFRVVYLFTSELSGTKDQLPAATVRLFPNPASDFFMLEQADAVQTIRLFALDGREVSRYIAAPGARYDLAGLPNGLYTALLEDNLGRPFQALELVKR